MTATASATATATATATPSNRLVLVVPATSTMTAVLTGDPVVATGALGVLTVDSNVQTGWHLDVGATRFDSGARQLPADALEITGVSVQVTSGQAPVNAVSYPVVVPTDGSATRFFGAADQSGRGVFDLTPAIRLSVPADAYAGAYTATLTITLSAGP